MRSYESPVQRRGKLTRKEVVNYDFPYVRSERDLFALLGEPYPPKERNLFDGTDEAELIIMLAKQGIDPSRINKEQIRAILRKPGLKFSSLVFLGYNL
ncbi:hypothetical protein HYW76_03430 [Candidatus Pacearchaeota archaeon]|nr:hypothetical protein [Candidatus Pacearchaeota archaeon]